MRLGVLPGQEAPHLLRGGLAWLLNLQGGKGPLRLPNPGVLTQVPPFTDPSVHASGACVDRQMDGRTAAPSFLPSSVHSFLLASELGLRSPRWSLSPSHGARRGLQQ